MLSCGCGDVTDLTVGHVDGLTIDYLNGAWTPTVWDRDHNIRYAPDEALLVAVPAARTTQPAGSQWDFLGAGAGNDVWILPQSQIPSLLYLGTDSERTAPGTFAPYFESDPRVSETAPWIKVSVRDVRGPGYFSMWQTGTFGTPIVWVSTADGISDQDAFYLVEGGHIHYNWAFTARGQYEVDVEATAYLGPGQTNPTSSGIITYCFSVERPGCLQFDAAGYSVNEEDGTATITVTRTHGSDGTITVDYASSDGTATAGTNYTPASGTLTFADGEVSKTFTVSITDDGRVKPDQTINLTLSNATNGAMLGDQNTAVLTVLQDDDVATVAGVTINDGTAQRSMVTSLTVNFSDTVTFDDGAFEVRNQAGNLVGVNVAASVDDGKTVAVLTFSGPDIVAGSLADGNYTLTVHADKVHDALGHDIDGDYSLAFYRLFGDSAGRRLVDDDDYALFQSTLGLSAGDPGFLAFFDYNGDGTIDDIDLGAFRDRLGTHLDS
jgi:surface-anchored protein